MEASANQGFRWRGGQVTRLEALTDAVFGFAITLLVVSLEVPATFDDLFVLMRGFVAFAFTFALLILVWFYHYRLFSHYDMEDGYTIVLNSVLLFVVLFYVYPLKFIASALLSGRMREAFSSGQQVADAMTVYAVGFISVFLVFGLLYRHAYQLRDRLRLTPVQALMARAHVMDCFVMVGAGVLSAVIAQTTPDTWGAFAAGLSYFLIGPAQWIVGTRFDRQRKALEAALAASPSPLA
jgi:uncharacterized membrane protein